MRSRETTSRRADGFLGTGRGGYGSHHIPHSGLYASIDSLQDMLKAIIVIGPAVIARQGCDRDVRSGGKLCQRTRGPGGRRGVKVERQGGEHADFRAKRLNLAGNTLHGLKAIRTAHIQQHQYQLAAIKQIADDFPPILQHFRRHARTWNEREKGLRDGRGRSFHHPGAAGQRCPVGINEQNTAQARHGFRLAQLRISAAEASKPDNADPQGLRQHRLTGHLSRLV